MNQKRTAPPFNLGVRLPCLSQTNDKHGRKKRQNDGNCAPTCLFCGEKGTPAVLVGLGSSDEFLPYYNIRGVRAQNKVKRNSLSPGGLGTVSKTSVNLMKGVATLRKTYSLRRKTRKDVPRQMSPPTEPKSEKNSRKTPDRPTPP